MVLVLGVGGGAEAIALVQGFEGHGACPFMVEECRDEDLLGGGIRPVGDAAGLGIVRIFADQVAVLLGLVSEHPQLGGYWKVHVLLVSGVQSVDSRGLSLPPVQIVLSQIKSVVLDNLSFDARLSRENRFL